MPHVRFNHLEEEVVFTRHDPKGPGGPIDLDKFRAALWNFRVKQGMIKDEKNGTEATKKEEEAKKKEQEAKKQ